MMLVSLPSRLAASRHVNPHAGFVPDFYGCMLETELTPAEISG
jgi:hypothetical protein